MIAVLDFMKVTLFHIMLSDIEQGAAILTGNGQTSPFELHGEDRNQCSRIACVYGEIDIAQRFLCNFCHVAHLAFILSVIICIIT